MLKELTEAEKQATEETRELLVSLDVVKILTVLVL
jgi:hypothetical protein